MSFYLVLNLVSAPEGYEQLRVSGVTQGLVILSSTGNKLVTVWNTSSRERCETQSSVLAAENIEVIITTEFYETGFAIEKFMS